MAQSNPLDEEPLSTDELMYWIEFGCWTVLFLAPFLYWINGPAVSTDQFVMRIGLVCLSAMGAVGLRVRKVLNRRLPRIMKSAPISSSRLTSILVGTLLSLHGGLLLWQAWCDSPTYDEPQHLAAGLSYWQTGHFGVYRGNPPLPRLVGSIPAVPFTSLPTIPDASASGAKRAFRLAQGMIQLNGAQSVLYIHLARTMLIPIALLGGWVAFLWARNLYGSRAGLFALLLWCSSPNLLAHGHLMTPDATATSLGLLACYRFYRWLACPGAGNACWAGLTLGLALLSKATWMLLFPVFVCSYVIFPAAMARAKPSDRIVQMAGICLLGIWVLNLGYGFEGSFRSLGSYQFSNSALSGNADHQPGNRFGENFLAHVPLPFPYNFVQGIDDLKAGIEQGQECYLRGQWRRGGWWYYYLYGLAVKVPLGVWCMAPMAALTLLSNRESHALRRNTVLLLPAVAVLLAASSQTDINKHFRYVLPVLPFLFIWLSQLAVAPHRIVRRLAAFASVWFVSSSLWISPHSLSYFNEVVGGPMHGHRHLIDSNVDWGQDLNYYHRLLQSPRFGAERPKLAYFGFVHPQAVGLDFDYPDYPDSARADWSPGLYTVSVNFVEGLRMPTTAKDGRLIRIHRDTFERFRQEEPVAMAGYSICLYRIND